MALRQTVLMAHRLISTMASKLQPRHRHVILSAQRMARVFNPTPMCASKETE